MKLTIGVVAGVLLTGLFLIWMSARPSAMAMSEGRNEMITKKSASASSRGAVSRAWKLGQPVKHENLTIFPVISDEAIGTEEFITLDEGLRTRKVKVREIGSENQSQDQETDNSQNRINVQQRRGDNAEVNRLAIINNSGKTLILIAGEIVLGGKQDRIVAHDCIVASTNTPVPIDVFCVEHGRWSPRSRASGESGAGFASAETVMASPKERKAAQAQKDQSAVWNEVAGKVSANHVSTSTGTLNSVYGDKKVNGRLKTFEAAFKTRLVSKNIVGAVVTVNGKVVSADVFANNALFRAYWPKLLKSYSLEAISAPKVKYKEVDSADAESFLSRVEGDRSVNEAKGIYSVKENQSEDDASFELEHNGDKSKLIHFNRVNKKY